MSKSTPLAISLISQPEFRVADSNLKRLQVRVQEQLRLIAVLGTETAVRGILVGIDLNQIKASLKHGEFGQWCEKNINVGRSQYAYYMRLGLKFLEDAKLSKQELLEIPSVPRKSAGAGKVDSKVKRILEKLRDFTGEHTLTELLIKHGIKSVGLRTALTAGENNALSPEQRVAQARERLWAETWESAIRIRQSLTEPEQLELFSDPAQVEQLKAEVVELNRLLDERLAALKSKPISI